MARVAINTGASANDGTGDNLRYAGGVVNNNFLELYTYLGEGSTTVLSAPIWSSTNVGISTLRNVGIGTTNATSTLTVSGNGRFTGVVTATTFIGALTGTATTATNAQGLTGTPNITVGVVTASALKVSTGTTGATIDFGQSGNLQYSQPNVTLFSSYAGGKVILTAESGIEMSRNNETVAYFAMNPSNIGYVELYYDNSKKFQTIGTGITVTGTTFTDQLSVTGVVTATTFIGNLTGTATSAGIATYTSEWILGQNASSDYTFTGPGLIGAENDPVLYLVRGQQYKFTNTMGAHPFRIQSTVNGSTGTQYNDGITNNDVSNGTLTWNVQFDAPNILYYQCTAHGSMGGKIYIIDAGIGPDISINTTGIITATSFFGNGSGLTGIIASGTGIVVKDSGSTVGTAGTIDFGDNLTVSTISAGVVTVTGSAGGGSSQFVTTAAGIHTLSNVGIGTTNPTSKLTVSGDVLVSGVSTFRDYLDINNPSSSSSSLRLHNVSLLSAATNFTKLSANAAVLAPEIGGGYAPLHLRSNNEIILQSVIDSSPVVYAGFTTTSSYLNYLGGTKLQTVGAGITVIGTTFTNQLIVSGVVTATSFFGNGSGLTGVIGSGSGVIIKDSGTTVGTAGTIDFGDNLTVSAISAGIVTVTGSFQFVTTAAGIHTLSNVGIGTTNPTSALTVSGDALINGITVGRGGSAVTYNTAIGASALYSNTGGTNNTGIGYSSLYSNTTGDYNTAIGSNALYLNTSTTANYNTAIGAGAGSSITTGSKNTILGSYTGNQNGLDIRTSNNNVVLSDGDGNIRFYANSSGNVGIGTTNPTSKLTVSGDVLINGITVGCGSSAVASNTAIGYQSLYNNTYGLFNVANGYYTLRYNTDGTHNTANGYVALYNNTTGDHNTATGSLALNFLDSGNNNTATGFGALNETLGSSNAGFGYFSGSSITTGSKNTILGSYTGNQNGLDIRTSNNNIVLSDGDGNIRFYAKSSGNVGIGTTNPQGTLQVGTGIMMFGSTGIISATTFVGNFSGSITNATNLTGGYANASQLNVSGIATISQGRIQADGSSNLRFGNIAAGSGSGRNIAIGDQVLYSLSSGQGRNIGIGELSYYDTTSGQYNIGLGIQAGQKITTGNYNVILGGYDGQTGLDIRTSSNNVVIADGQGNIRQYINSSGNVGIKTTVITEALTVAGIVSATSFYGTLNAGQLTGSLPAINGSALIGVVGSGSGVIIQGNGTPVGTAGTINFASNLNVTFASGIATVSVPYVTYASVAGVATVATNAQGLTGTPSISVTNVTANRLILPDCGNLSNTNNTGKLTVGNTTNFKIYHLNQSGFGTQNRIEVKNYPLYIGTIEEITLDNFYHTNLVSLIPGTTNAKVELGFGTSFPNTKLETTGYGVSIYGGINAPTGIITASSFSGSGSGLTNLPAAQLTGTLPAIDGSALLNVTAAGTGVAIRDDNSNIGSATTINFGTGLDVTFSAGIATITASGGSLQSRTTVSGVTTSIANNGIGNTNITGFKSYGLMKVGLSTAGWLRLYTDSTSRANDISRSVGTDPAPGSGVIAEVVTTGITTTQIISPFVMGGNLDNSPTTTIYAAITNLSGITQAITANLTILQLEA